MSYPLPLLCFCSFRFLKAAGRCDPFWNKCYSKIINSFVSKLISWISHVYGKQMLKLNNLLTRFSQFKDLRIQFKKLTDQFKKSTDQFKKSTDQFKKLMDQFKTGKCRKKPFGLAKWYHPPVKSTGWTERALSILVYFYCI